MSYWQSSFISYISKSWRSFIKLKYYNFLLLQIGGWKDTAPDFLPRIQRSWHFSVTSRDQSSFISLKRWVGSSSAFVQPDPSIFEVLSYELNLVSLHRLGHERVVLGGVGDVTTTNFDCFTWFCSHNTLAKNY